MQQKFRYLLTAIFAFIFLNSFNIRDNKTIFVKEPKTIQKDTVKIVNDSIKFENNYKLILFKKEAHASYYHQKFDGRKTASGEIFKNDKLTAAHRKLPFGTKLRITNEVNGKSVIVTINDRGPFVKGREIDLSKKAFMEIATSTKQGTMRVTIEKIEE